MTAIKEVQLVLQNLLKRIVSQAEIGKALGTGRANISLRIKNNSGLNDEEIRKIEKYFNVPFAEIIENTNAADDNIKQNTGSLFYKKLIHVINSADDIELEFYYNMIKQGQKCISSIKTQLFSYK